MLNREESKTYTFISLIFFILILTSCATVQEPTVQNQVIPWETRSQAVSTIQTWDLKALIAIRQKNDAWSANLQWQQQPERYQISLFGPLGTNSYELTGQAGSVQLATAAGKTFTAATPEILLQQQTGSEVPVSNLYYWIRGLPVPHLPATKKFDEYHHLVELNQQGWKVRYLRYMTVKNQDMPNKIFLDSAALNVKIIINQWRF